jgi:hypothetical protein
VTSYRRTPLPIAALRGRYVLAPGLVDATGEALARPGSDPDGDEAICYWAGRSLGSLTILTTVVVPRATRQPYRVVVDEAAFGDAARIARSLQLGLLAQVHSHPGQSVEHSDGDDRLVTLPFEGMLSVVVPNYARRRMSLMDVGVHQFQDGRWASVTAHSVRAGVITVPLRLDI